MEPVFVPVRHHSPACARLVRAMVEQLSPSRVLVEGPSDYMRHAELLLDHQLPIAIYTFVRSAEGRSGAYYPFCEYSPEWQVIRAAGERGIPFEFIDLPWRERAMRDVAPASSYGDGPMRQARLVTRLCEELGVTGFDALWDTLFEIDPDVPHAALLKRLRTFCDELRATDEACGAVRASDVQREAFMRERIADARAAWKPGDGPLLVVTGGYHTPALERGDAALALARTLHEPSEAHQDDEGDDGEADADEGDAMDDTEELGIALTPYSFERLDGQTGYAAGMPSPGFYQALWRGADPLHLAVRALRERKQGVSTADLIAADALARSLAALRGHARVFRTDVLDGVRLALVKDAMDGARHPVLDAVLAAFRGNARGRLADGTERPPLVHDVERTLRDEKLLPEPVARSVDLRLLRPDERRASSVLHRVACLRLRGIALTEGTDFATRADLADPSERWTLHWTPEFEGDLIEASLYGSTLREASLERLRERAEQATRDAETAALLCLEAAQADLGELGEPLFASLVTLLREEGDFARLSRALGHLLYLVRFDEALGSAGDARYAALLVEAYERGIWLLAATSTGAPDVLEGVAHLVDARQRCAETLPLPPLVDILFMVLDDPARHAALRGAAAGALYALGSDSGAAIADRLGAFALPTQLGDFLSGVFTLAREVVRVDPSLMQRLDELLLAFSDDDFLAALPALRLAFSFFPPREKHHLIDGLMRRVGDMGAPLEALAVTADAAADAMRLERSLIAELRAHGVSHFDTHGVSPVDEGQP